MIRHENESGSVNVSTSVYTDIVGTAASNCFGVKGMAARSVKDGVFHLLRPESMSKGVLVSEVRYVVTKCTGTQVRAVNVYIDSMMIG